MIDQKLKNIFLFLIATCYSLVAFSQTKDVNTKDSAKHVVDGYNIFSNKVYLVDSISLNSKPAMISQIRNLNFISGTIFFSGANFKNVLSHSVQGNCTYLQKYFENCTSGSRISFVMCRVGNPNGNGTTMINKTIIFR